MIRLVVAYGAVGLSLRSPPGFARSPCAQKIKFPSGDNVPPLARCISLPVGVMVSEDQILVVGSWVMRDIMTAFWFVLGELMPEKLYWLEETNSTGGLLLASTAASWN